MSEKIAVIFCIAFCHFTASTKDLIWEGTVTVSQAIKVEPPDTLVITPGTIVNFSNSGRLVCNGCQLDIDGVEFSASNPLRGEQRILFKGITGTISNCVFRNLKTVDLKWHNAFLSINESSLAFRGNLLMNCSALEFFRCQQASVIFNLFRDCSRALVLFHQRNAIVQNNLFRNCHQEAIMLSSKSSRCLIQANRFFNCDTAIKLFGGSVHDNFIVGDSIFNGRRGVTLWGGPRNNTIICALIDGPNSAFRLKGGQALDNIVSNCVFWNTNYSFERENVTDGEGINVQNCVISGKCPTLKGLIMRGNLILDEDSSNTSRIFQDADNGDFRPCENSPLINGGAPRNISIGIFPLFGEQHKR